MYLTLNPAELKRRIGKKIHVLFEAREEKNRRFKTPPFKRQRPQAPKKESYIFDDLTTPALVT